MVESRSSQGLPLIRLGGTSAMPRVPRVAASSDTGAVGNHQPWTIRNFPQFSPLFYLRNYSTLKLMASFILKVGLTYLAWKKYSLIQCLCFTHNSRNYCLERFIASKSRVYFWRSSKVRGDRHFICSDRSESKGDEGMIKTGSMLPAEKEEASVKPATDTKLYSAQVR